MYISVYDLALMILFVVTITVSAYLIAVLRRAICVLGHVRVILDNHHEQIGEALSLLPETLENVNALAVSLKATSDETSSAFRSLQNDLVDTADNFRDGLETIVVYAKLIGDVVRAVFSKAVK